jgi:predicted nucleic acid-binding protein
MPRIQTLTAGTRVFIDSNIFVFATTHSGPLGQACTALLARVERDELSGITSTSVAAEVMHRLMVNEAREQFGFPSSRHTVEHLQQHPETVRQLTQHLGVASQIRRLHVDIVPLTVKDLHTSKALRRDHGLLTNDSLILAVMRSHKLLHLATHDSGFLRVPAIQVWMPGGAT